MICRGRLVVPEEDKDEVESQPGEGGVDGIRVVERNCGGGQFGRFGRGMVR